MNLVSKYKNEFSKKIREKGEILYNNKNIKNLEKDLEENIDAFRGIITDNDKNYSVFVGDTPEGVILLCECTKEKIDTKHSTVCNCEHEYAMLLEIDKRY